MDSLTIFGLFAVTAMLVLYALEDRNSWYILGFGGACALGSAYGFLQGAWPFGVVEVGRRGSAPMVDENDEGLTAWQWGRAEFATSEQSIKPERIT